jgi:hypothetical protein
MSKKKVKVISPDGIPLEFGVSSYQDMEKAKEAFNNWKKRFIPQGYYSSCVYGNIPVDNLEHYCTFISI